MNNDPNNFSFGSQTGFAKIVKEDPIWDSYTDSLYPNTLLETFDWANWIRTRYGDYESLIHRAVSYFLNGVDLVSNSDLDTTSLNSYEEKLLKKHNILTTLSEIGMDLHFNGNVFLSVMQPIRRALKCPECGSIRYLSHITRGEDYEFSKGTFTGSCPGCDAKGLEFTVLDYVDSTALNPLSIINWNPYNVRLDSCTITGRERISYVPSKEDKDFVEDTTRASALESLPMKLLEAISTDQVIEFKDGFCLHLKTATNAINRGNTKGWGLPSWLKSFKFMVMLLLLERQLESGIKDFILPIRLLFPSPSTLSSGSDPMAGNSFNLPLNQIKGAVTQAITNQAKKHSSWHMVPAPVEQLQLGGDGKVLIPVDILEYVKTQLMDSQCIPQEFAKSSLFSLANTQPQGLRMFEHTWKQQVEEYDKFLVWYLDRCNKLLSWPSLEGVINRPSVENDPARMQMLYEMAGQGVISKSTLLRSMSIDPRSEAKVIEEERVNDAIQETALNNRLMQLQATGDIVSLNTQESLMAAQSAMQGEDPNAQGGAPVEGGEAPAGGAPAPQGGGYIQQPTQTGDPMRDISNFASLQPGANPSVEQLQIDAQLATEYIVNTPLGTARNQLYAMLREKNETLHAIVLTMVDKSEARAKNQGLEQARAGGQQ